MTENERSNYINSLPTSIWDDILSIMGYCAMYLGLITLMVLFVSVISYTIKKGFK